MDTVYILKNLEDVKREKPDTKSHISMITLI